MIIGFTGSRKGMTNAQKDSIIELLKIFKPTEVHHGDCIGADHDFHKLIWHETKIVIHPPVKNMYRAWCTGRKGDEILRPKEYLERNRDIVDVSDLLIATPEGEEKVRSGTWSTVRYARKKDKQLVIVTPDGSRRWENDQ